MKNKSFRTLDSKISTNILSFIFVVLIISPFYFLMDYPFNLNPDIINYSTDYINSNWSYEVGYELVGYFFREIIGFNFEQYWSSILIFQIVLLIFIYSKKHIYIFALSNIYVMSEFFYGTQVRYSMACLLFAFTIICISPQKRMTRYIGWIVSFLLHYGLSFLIIAYLLKDRVSKWILNKNILSYSILVIVTIFSSSLLINLINIILPYTRFSYYSGSDYLVSKSLLSTLYIVIFLSLILLAVKVDNSLNKDPIIRFSVTILYFCLISNSVAVLSGRLLLFLFILEPFILAQLLFRRKTNIIGVALLSLSLLKLYNYVSLNNVF
ncbi:TPA: EpsG family protein [Photobacterium damselae]